VVTSDLARILGDLAVVVFLLVGGHHVAIQAVAGLGGAIVPGQFSVGPQAAELLIDRSADIFRVGVLLSAPLLVAMLLTNAVLGLISKAVPSVNIFIVSFPLTIGIGLILTVLALPDVVRFVNREFTGMENSILAVTRDAQAPNIGGTSRSFDAAGQAPSTGVGRPALDS
jgi:flagellar biosynthetic protein FliR